MLSIVSRPLKNRPCILYHYGVSAGVRDKVCVIEAEPVGIFSYKIFYATDLAGPCVFLGRATYGRRSPHGKGISAASFLPMVVLVVVEGQTGGSQ
jgi:hypothetical protein